jgi:GT2 family glycosyltransferase
MATLAVIIVSYNTCDLLRQALHAVLAAVPALHALPEAVALQLLVVDNGSHDGSAAMAAAEFPGVALLASAENLGFTGGNNAALAALGFPVPGQAGGRWTVAPVPRPDFVLLLNPDTAVEPVSPGRRPPAPGCSLPTAAFNTVRFISLRWRNWLSTSIRCGACRAVTGCWARG